MQHKRAVEPLTLFYSYAHEDESLRQQLEIHLSMLRRQGLISQWHDRQIIAGTEWKQEIDAHLKTASIILLLISPDFLASDYCYDSEMQLVLERHKCGEAHVIPLILRPCEWPQSPFALLEVLPHNSKPVTSWHDRDEAWLNITTGIRAVVEELYGSASHKPPHPQPSRHRQSRNFLLRRVRTFWIDGVLEQSLHKAALIALGLQEQPDALANPWHLTVQESNRSPHALPADTRITQVYDQTDGELLILGEPGAGKTTLLLELARDLLTRAEQNEMLPMPVVFHLSSWAEKRQPFAQWLVEELHSKYQVQRSSGKTWITQERILPLLDGLDEMPEEARSACIIAIKTYREQYQGMSLVVCCRSREYFAQEQRFAFLYAVIIQPLITQQIDTYLASASGQLEEVRVALRNDTVLQELITTPLLLSVLTLTYQGSSLDTLQGADTREALQQRLFATYSEQMLKRRGSHPHFTERQIMQWLSWLARQMIQHNQSPFFIERIQPNWLSNRLLRWGYGIIVGLVVGLLFMVLFVAAGLYTSMLYMTPTSYQAFWFFAETGLIVGLITGFISCFQKEIKPAERVLWSWERARRAFGYGFILLIPLLSLLLLSTFFILSIIVGLISGSAGGTYWREIQSTARVEWKWSWTKAWRGAIYGIAGLTLLFEILSLTRFAIAHQASTFIVPLLQLSTALLLALIFGISGNTLEKNIFIRPNEGMRVSALNGVRYGACTVLIFGLIAIISIELLNILLDTSSADYLSKLRSGLSIALFALPFILFTSLFFGLITWLLTGGLACIQHIVLRLLLQSTKSIPGKYPQFLDYAAERILLRKVGGGYIFIHRLLLDYFANLHTDGSSSSSTTAPPIPSISSE